MAKIIYRKSVPKPKLISKGKRIPPAAGALMIIGALIIGAVTGPIISYLLITSPQLRRDPGLISPLPIINQLAVSPEEPNQSVLAAAASQPQRDYTNLDTWFPSGRPELTDKLQVSKITHYNVSIPRLRITNAVVEIGGTDLAKSLIHYPGTASPGELGSVVIFGHSILRQFYNPNNYMSIFSTIMTLNATDEIIVNFDGVRYTYKVIDKIEVKPTDIQILEQRYNGRFLKLITCTPEGTYLRRGIVIAELTK